MNAVLWVIAGVSAAAFAAAGTMKIVRPRAKLLESGMTWAEDFTPAMVKFIGIAELLGAIGLVLPAIVDVATWLVPLAATGLAVTMVGAVITHVRRGEIPGAVPAVVLGVLSVVVAWGRFGPYSF